MILQSSMINSSKMGILLGSLCLKTQFNDDHPGVVEDCFINTIKTKDDDERRQEANHSHINTVPQ